MKSQLWKLALLLPLALVVFSQSAPAQQTSMDELRKQIDVLGENMKSMQKDLQEIKALLQNRVRVAPPLNTVLDLGKRPSRGESTAKLTLVAFLDHQCQYCGQFIRETMPKIDEEYIRTGKVRYVVLNLPLEGIHQSAFKAAEATACAGEQGKFWEMSDRLFAHQQALDNWKSHADAIGLDASKFEECMESGKGAAQVRSDMAEAHKANLTGTPAFFLAFTDSKSSTIKTVTRLVGAQPYTAFKAAIDKQLVANPEAANSTDSRGEAKNANSGQFVESAVSTRGTEVTQH